MYCQRCGHLNDDKAKFCNNCGNKFQGDSAPFQQNNQYTPQPNMYYPPPQKKSYKGLIIGIGVAAAVIVVLVVLYFTVFRYMLVSNVLSDMNSMEFGDYGVPANGQGGTADYGGPVNTPGETTIAGVPETGTNEGPVSGVASLTGLWINESGQSCNLLVFWNDGTVSLTTSGSLYNGTYSYDNAQDMGTINVYIPFTSGYSDITMVLDGDSLDTDYGLFSKISEIPDEYVGIDFPAASGYWYQAGGAEIWLSFNDDGNLDISYDCGNSTYMGTYTFNESEGTGYIESTYLTGAIYLNGESLIVDTDGGIEFIREYTGPVIVD